MRLLLLLIHLSVRRAYIRHWPRPGSKRIMLHRFMFRKIVRSPARYLAIPLLALLNAGCLCGTTQTSVKGQLADTQRYSTANSLLGSTCESGRTSDSLGFSPMVHGCDYAPGHSKYVENFAVHGSAVIDLEHVRHRSCTQRIR